MRKVAAPQSAITVQIGWRRPVGCGVKSAMCSRRLCTCLPSVFKDGAVRGLNLGCSCPQFLPHPLDTRKCKISIY